MHGARTHLEVRGSLSYAEPVAVEHLQCVRLDHLSSLRSVFPMLVIGCQQMSIERGAFSAIRGADSFSIGQRYNPFSNSERPKK